MNREEMLGRLRSGQAWDVVVIGGGATGLGAAVDAATRGYRTLLLEASDFAKATSSRSTKLVHGGVRYLAQGRIGLVREALHERALLRQNAPHLVHDLGFVVPAYTWWSKPYYGLGLKLYDVLAGGHGWGASRAVSREEVLERLPTLKAASLRGGIIYRDGQFDDARLAIALALTLIDQGGTALNYVEVTALRKNAGRIAGVNARDAESGETFAIDARVVINATGVFADAVRRLDDPSVASMIAPSQGAHLVLDRSFLPGDSALMVPRTDDGRVLFAIPWHGRVIVGTTDTPVARVALEPRPLAAEVEFLLKHAGRYFNRAPAAADVLSAYAGLRPLVGSPNGERTASLSREHALVISASGLVTITGGKWTTYRRMGAQTIDRAARVGGLPARESQTATLRLHGWQLDPAARDHGLHGSDLASIDRLVADDPELGRPLEERLPYRAADVVWAARHEAARTVEDVLARRTRALLLDARASMAAAPLVADLVARALGQSADWQAEQVQRYQQLAAGYTLG
jgi:glycerol-3-phosphate dehydrogenase